jgi:dsDNA-specific endonuclease/ATPase MutS2
MALRFLSEEANLVAELAKYDEEAREHVIAGAQKILLGRIDLVRSDAAKRTNKRAMEGLKLLKKDTIAVENIYSQIRSLFNFELEQGEQQRQQAYESLKAQFEEKLKQMGSQAVQSQAAIEEQFRQELRRVLAQIDVQYINQLDEYKRELEAVG